MDDGVSNSTNSSAGPDYSQYDSGIAFALGINIAVFTFLSFVMMLLQATATVDRWT